MISAFAGLALFGVVLLLFETVVLDVVVAALSVMAVYEMINAAGLVKNKTFAGVCVAFAAFFSTMYFQTLASISGFVEFGFALVLLLFVLNNHNEVNIKDAAYAFLFSVMIPKAFVTVLLFRNYGEPVCYFLALMGFAVAWINDTCAYFSGYFFGNRKLCPEISPKKTVEGAIGGVFGAVIICSILAYIFSLATGYPINWVSFVIFLPVGAILAILGDLCASVIKRQFGIKDYGSIMPGHGGVMDRFDSWIFVAPLAYIWNIYYPFI